MWERSADLHFLLLFTVVLKLEHEQMEQPSEEEVTTRLSDVLNPFNLLTEPTVSKSTLAAQQFDALSREWKVATT